MESDLGLQYRRPYREAMTGDSKADENNNQSYND